MTYEYHCDACDLAFERQVPVAERASQPCPQCARPAEKLFSTQHTWILHEWVREKLKEGWSGLTGFDSAPSWERKFYPVNSPSKPGAVQCPKKHTL